jgi:membrane-associated phospholipid phosphatase
MSNPMLSLNPLPAQKRKSRSLNMGWFCFKQRASFTVFKNAVVFCIFFGSSCLKSSAQINKLDVSTVQELSEDRKPWETKTFRFFTNTTNDISLAIPLSLFIAGTLNGDKAMCKNALITTESLALSTAVTFALKYSVKRERPYARDSLITKIGPGGGYSFPSGHTSQAFSVATSLAIAYPKWYVIVPAYLWAGSVAYSRMYLGVHYPSDILAGALVGSGSALLMHKINKWMTESKERKKITTFLY